MRIENESKLKQQIYCKSIKIRACHNVSVSAGDRPAEAGVEREVLNPLVSLPLSLLLTVFLVFFVSATATLTR